MTFSSEDVLLHWSDLTSIPPDEVEAYRNGKADRVPEYADDLDPLLPITTPNICSDWPIWADQTVAQCVSGCVCYSILTAYEEGESCWTNLVRDYLFTTHCLLLFARDEQEAGNLESNKLTYEADERYKFVTPVQKRIIAYALSVVLSEEREDFEGSLADGFNNYWNQYLE